MKNKALTRQFSDGTSLDNFNSGREYMLPYGALLPGKTVTPVQIHLIYYGAQIDQNIPGQTTPKLALPFGALSQTSN